MLHTDRTWSVTTITDADELAEKLGRYSWCLCTGWRYGNTLWLNDSTSEDALQEYAVVRYPELEQIESITVSWCKREELLKRIVEYDALGHSMEDLYGSIGHEQLDEDHEPCRLCA
jgi:hypothetical protein